MLSSFKGRIPLLLAPNAPPTTEHFPTTQDLARRWHMVASSSSFWKKQKHSISIQYQVKNTGAAGHMDTLPATLDDIATYSTHGASTTSSMKGSSTLSTSVQGVYDWRGRGLLRLVSTQWEIVAYGSIRNTDIVALVVLVGKTVFSAQTLSLYCNEKDGLSKEDVEEIVGFLRKLGGESLGSELDEMQIIPQD